jgi:hypothetical protein
VYAPDQERAVIQSAGSEVEGDEELKVGEEDG